MNWVDKLIIEYERGRRELRDMASCLGESENDKNDKTLLNSMIADMTFTLEWMGTGREPDTYRGIDRRNAYQKIFLEDLTEKDIQENKNTRITDLFESLDIEPKNPLTESEKRFVVTQLSKLTALERQCFILNKAYLWTQEEIGEELDMTRDAVKDALKRCENKFRRELF